MMLNGKKTYLGCAILLLSALPWFSADTRSALLTVGLSIMGIGLRHAIAKTNAK